MAKKPDFKQMMLQHGERIGLGVAVFLSVLLIFVFLFGFGFDSGLLSGSPAEKVSVLDGATKTVERKLNDPNNKPGDSDKPPANSRDKLIVVKSDPIEANDFRVSLLSDKPLSELGRRQPKILRLEEGATAVARVQIKSFLFASGTPPRVYVYKDAVGGTTGGEAPPPGTGAAGKGGPPPGAGGMLGGGLPKGNLPGFGKKGKNKGLFDGLPGKFGEDSKKDRQVVPIPVTEFVKGGKTPAMQVRPMRMAIIAASFPYREQVNQFKRSLNLKNVPDVLNEAATPNPKEKNPKPQFAFRFLGVVAERRELDSDNKPVTGWTTLNLNEDYKPYVVLTGRSFEPDDKKLAAVMVPGLTMPRLLQFNSQPVEGGVGEEPGGMPPRGGPGGAPPPGGMPPGAVAPGGMPPRGMGEGIGGAQQTNTVLEDQYPTIESELPTIKQTLEDLKDKDPASVAPPPRFTPEDNFDIFQGSRPPATADQGDTTGKGPRGGFGLEGGFPGEQFKENVLPDYCLVRLVDVTIQPGKTYEYRLQVRMANPNQYRKDTAAPNYATEEELKSEWSNVQVGDKKPVSLIVRVDPELTYFAVDQKQYDWFNPKDKEKKAPPYVGPYAREQNPDQTPIRRDRQFYLQAHRWIERAPNSSNQVFEIGEWVVAERLPIYRGEYVGRSERIDLPVWKYSREDFLIATDATTPKNGTGIQVSFGHNSRGQAQPETILIDFSSGESKYNRVVSRTEEKVETKLVSDTTAGDVLMMNPDGKLIYRETATDANDETRQQRVEKVRTRIKKLKESNTGGAEKKGGFGDTGP